MYDYVHYDSPDERGIDVAMIYDTRVFKVINTEVFPLDLVDENGRRDYTRDILMVEGELNNELMYFVVNHWPSRRQGVEESEPTRLLASKKALEVISKIRGRNQYAKIIVMGDFNAIPSDAPIKLLSKNLDDSFNEFAIEKPFGTFNGFELNSKLTNRIDYIFTKNLDVYEYKHIYKKLPNGLWPSDHLPIFVSINE